MKPTFGDPAEHGDMIYEHCLSGLLKMLRTRQLWMALSSIEEEVPDQGSWMKGGSLTFKYHSWQVGPSVEEEN